MKKIIFIYLVFILNVAVGQSKIVKNLGDFSTLKVYNGIEVELINSTENKIEISGKKSEKVKIKQIDNTLKIVLKFPEISADGNVLVKLYYKKQLAIIDANEGATITGKNINQDSLIVKSQERAFINLVIKVKKLEVKAISGGIIKLTGSAENQDVVVDLYGIYHGFPLLVKEVSKVKAGTGSKAEITTEKELNATVNFGGSIFYKGNPKLITNKKVAGGIIKQRK